MMNESMTDCREGRKELYSSVRHPGMELSLSHGDGVTFILLWQMGSHISPKGQGDMWLSGDSHFTV